MEQLTPSNSNRIYKAVDLDLIESFIDYIDASQKTIETYTRAIKQFYIYLQSVDVKQPTRNTIKDYKIYLERTGHKATTIQNYIAALRQFFKWAESIGAYPDIAKDIKAIKLSKVHKKDYLTSNQIKNILDNIDLSNEIGLRDYAIILLMTTGGLRTIEVSRAKIEDVHVLGDDTILLIQGKGQSEKGDYIKLPRDTENAIRMYLKSRQDDKEPSSGLFVSTSRNNKGKPLTTRSISAIVKKRMQSVGLDSSRLTAHSLRHTAVTLALLNGRDLQEVQQFARHINLSTTMIYSHAIERSKNTCEATIEQAIFNDSDPIKKP